MKVGEIMTRGAEFVHPDDSVQEAADRMKAIDVGALPVCEHGRLVGMITDRDITVRSTAEGDDPWTTKVRHAMTAEVDYCREDDDIAVAARLMKDKEVRRLMVLDQENQLVGIVSLGDLAVHVGDEQISSETLERLSEPAAPKR
jgi:CBS domain-containing protein